MSMETLYKRDLKSLRNEVDSLYERGQEGTAYYSFLREKVCTLAILLEEEEKKNSSIIMNKISS